MDLTMKHTMDRPTLDFVSEDNPYIHMYVILLMRPSSQSICEKVCSTVLDQTTINLPPRDLEAPPWIGTHRNSIYHRKLFFIN